MLFFIDDSIPEALETRGHEDENLVVAIDQIAYARRAGNHIVLGEPDCLIELARNELLSRISRSVYEKLSRMSVYNWSLLESVSDVIVVYDGSVPTVTNNTFPANKRYVHISHFVKQSFCSPTVLLAENITDARIYSFIANRYIIRNNYKALSITCEYMGGGGNTIWMPYKQFQETSDRICFCVVDSDIEAPGLELGQTAKKLRTTHDADCQTTSWTYINARNLESLIPTGWYTAYASHNHSVRLSHEHNERVFSGQTKEIKRYADIKSGMIAKTIFKAPPKSKLRTFWDGIVLSSLSENDAQKICVLNGDCQNSKSCGCSFIKSMGSDIADKVFHFINTLEENVTSELTMEPWIENEWNLIGANVFAWCCGDEGFVT